MSDAPAWALGALELPDAAAVGGQRLHGSRSGASVHLLDLPDGPAVLKATAASAGSTSLQEAQRELALYRHTAPDLPLRTPRLLRSCSTADGVAMLLTAHVSSGAAVDPQGQAAAGWALSDWLLIARDLAGLHASPPPTAVSETGRWVVEALADPAMPVLEEFWSCPGEPELLSGLLGQGSALAAAISAPTPCLLHGDCHLGNLLREDGRLVWIDWQATGTGSPALDLAFCCARAVPEADPPVRELVHAYAATRHVDETRLASAVLAAEPAILLASWPHFARCNTPAAVGRVHRRVHLLARAWHEA